MNVNGRGSAKFLSQESLLQHVHWQLFQHLPKYQRLSAKSPLFPSASVQKRIFSFEDNIVCC